MRCSRMHHKCYGGIDLPVDWMYVGVIAAEGEVRVHQNMRPDPQAFLQARQPFRAAVVVGVEGLVTWDLAR
jgi:hypothetical protein